MKDTQVFSRDMTGPEFGVWLLRRHADLIRSADARIRRMLVSTDELPESYDVRRAIVVAVGNNMPLEAGRDWWASNAATSSTPFVEFHKAHLLLRHLDVVFAELSPFPHPVEDTILMTGSRWWNLRQVAETGGFGTLDGPPFRSTYHFPHIRLVDREMLIRARYPDTFRDVWITHEMRIGLCSLSGKARTAFAPTKILDSKRSVYGFRSSGIRTDEDATFPGAGYLQELTDCLDWARTNRIHVLCFPELSVCPEGQKRLVAELEKNPGVLGLVVGGSFHVERDGGQYVNAAPYWVVTTSDGVKGQPEYEKVEPFSTRVRGAKALPQMKQCCDTASVDGCVHLCEDITPGSKIHVVETAAGVFGILICRDFLSGQQYIEQYARVVDHLLVVSMNASENAWFWASSEDPLRSNAVATFYVNSTQVVTDANNAEVEVAFWNTPRDKQRVYRALPAVPGGAQEMPEDGRILTTFRVPGELLDF